jgi:hypothetical protein
MIDADEYVRRYGGQPGDVCDGRCLSISKLGSASWSRGRHGIRPTKSLLTCSGPCRMDRNVISSLPKHFDWAALDEAGRRVYSKRLQLGLHVTITLTQGRMSIVGETSLFASLPSVADDSPIMSVYRYTSNGAFFEPIAGDCAIVLNKGYKSTGLNSAWRSLQRFTKLYACAWGVTQDRALAQWMKAYGQITAFALPDGSFVFFDPPKLVPAASESDANAESVASESVATESIQTSSFTQPNSVMRTPFVINAPYAIFQVGDGNVISLRDLHDIQDQKHGLRHGLQGQDNNISGNHLDKERMPWSYWARLSRKVIAEVGKCTMHGVLQMKRPQYDSSIAWLTNVAGLTFATGMSHAEYVSAGLPELDRAELGFSDAPPDLSKIPMNHPGIATLMCMSHPERESIVNSVNQPHRAPGIGTVSTSGMPGVQTI